MVTITEKLENLFAKPKTQKKTKLGAINQHNSSSLFQNFAASTVSNVPESGFFISSAAATVETTPQSSVLPALSATGDLQLTSSEAPTVPTVKVGRRSSNSKDRENLGASNEDKRSGSDNSPQPSPTNIENEEWYDMQGLFDDLESEIAQHESASPSATEVTKKFGLSELQSPLAVSEPEGQIEAYFKSGLLIFDSDQSIRQQFASNNTDASPYVYTSKSSKNKSPSSASSLVPSESCMNSSTNSMASDASPEGRKEVNQFFRSQILTVHCFA